MSWKCPAGFASLIVILSFQAAIGETTGNWGADGARGVLHVHGALTESACRLEMASAEQTVELGETGTGQLMHPGDRGSPVAFNINLRDCLRSGGHSYDEQTGNLLWDPAQPAATVGFMAPADADNPELLSVRGTSGLALRITDSSYRNIRLGSRGIPLLLTPGQNLLTYYVVAERTRAPLVAGEYRAHVDFWLNYD
jgi:type 1 fimbria pilin